MTDLATKPGADETAPDDDSVDAVDDAELDSDDDTDAGDSPDASEDDLEANDTEVIDDSPVDDAEVAADSPVDETGADDQNADLPADADEAHEAAHASDEPADAQTDAAAAEIAVDAATAETAVIAGAPDLAGPPHDASTPATVDSTEAYAWAPAEPKPRKSRKRIWIGIAAGVAVVGLIASSLVLIAPGTSVAGVGVGGLTPGGAADVLQQRLAETTIVLTGDGEDAVVTGADLGASVDAEALAEAAFAAHPAWNPTTWFASSVDATVDIDEAAATVALREAAPDLFVDPVDATLAYDAASAMYVTTPAEAGQGIDVDAVLAALQDAYDAGESRVEFEPVMAPVDPTTSTEVATETAATLNKVLGTAGFYVGKERTVPVDRALAASWLTVTQQGDGTFGVTADEAAIQKVVDTLPKAVDRGVVNATVITDSGGGVLQEVTKGVAGRTLGDTSDVAGEYAAQLANGNGVYAVPVTVKDFATTALARRVEVDISEQRAYLFENGSVVNSYYISSGLPGHDTDFGHFRIYAKVALQNMGDRELIKADYFTPNVPWISYFNGDEALHGAYWHNNFGNRMSHGCVNMPVDAARLVYDWAPIGTEVWVHA